MTGPQPLPSILDIVPYKGGESSEDGWKLSSNENPLGASPAAIEALNEAAKSLERYPDGGATELRQALAGKYGLDAERIICGAGSDEILQLLGRAYLRPGDEVIQTAHAFLVYRLVAQQAGAIMINVAEKDFTADVDAILAAVTEKTRIVFLANPNNPTGSYLPFDEVKRLHAGLPDRVLLVIDAAYAEYVRRNDYDAGTALAGETPNVIMTRTFSKIYGLAALRLGWAYGPASVIDALHRVRGPFNVSAPAQAAGVAALADERFVNTSYEHNAAELERVSAGVTALGYEIIPSVGNFLMIRFPTVPGKDKAAADAFLRARGIVIRDVTAYGLPEFLRLSFGTVEANNDVLAALEAFAAG